MLWQVLSEAPALHTLVIHNRKDAALLLGYLFDSRVDLKQLILRCCSLGEDSTGLLAYIAAFYTDLEVLALEGCHPLTFAGYALIPCLKKLSELNLSHCKVNYLYIDLLKTSIHICLATQENTCRNFIL